MRDIDTLHLMSPDMIKNDPRVLRETGAKTRETGAKRRETGAKKKSVPLSPFVFERRDSRGMSCVF